MRSLKPRLHDTTGCQLNRLSNGFDNRFDNRVEEVVKPGCTTGILCVVAILAYN